MKNTAITLAVGLLSLALQATPAFAGAQSLFQVMSDAKPDKRYEVQVATDDAGDITGMNFVSMRRSGQILEVEKWTLAEIQKGVTVLQEGQYKVMILTGRSLTAKDGGTVTIDYLRSGLSGERGKFGMEMQRLGAKWQIYTSRNTGMRAFTLMNLLKNEFLGRVVGIRAITVQ
jgi:hypothetical protein